MPEISRDATIKVERANKHISDLKDAIRALEDTYTSRVEMNREVGYQKLIHTFPYVESELSKLAPVVGDSVHNLRSAVDFAYNATLKRLVPVQLSPYSKFPVYDTREQLEKTLRGKGRRLDITCPPLFRAILDEIQPYKRGKNGVMYALHQLDIPDKHLLLLGLRPNAFVKGIVLQKKNGEMTTINTLTLGGSGQFEIAFPASVKIKENGKLHVSITVEEAGVFNGIPVIDLLKAFSQYVFYVMKLLANI